MGTITSSNSVKDQISNTQSSNQNNEIQVGTVIEYELHGKPIIAICQSEHNGKWSVINEFDESYSLKPDRIFVIYPAPNSHNKSNLKSISKEIKDNFSSFNMKKMEEIWISLNERTTDIPLDDFCALLDNSNHTTQNKEIKRAALRRALNADSVYFRRSAEGFKARTSEEVNNGKENERTKAQEESAKLILKLTLEKRLSGDKKSQLPPEISFLEEIAALGKKSSKWKLLEETIDYLSKKTGIPPKSSAEEKAFNILVKANHFSEHQNLSHVRLGRPVLFSGKERQEAEEIYRESKNNSLSERIDITSIYTFTIDSESTLDFDDAISITEKNGSYEVGVHITDVGEYIKEDSDLYNAALRRGTSVYCPDEVIPMLPNSLSEGVFSLKEGGKRPAISFFFSVKDGLLKSDRIESTVIKVSKRFSYEDIDEMLFDDKAQSNLALVGLSKNASEEQIFTANKIPELIKEIWDICSNQELARLENGAVLFSRRDLLPVVNNKKITLESNSDDSPSRKIVSELMIAANSYAAEFSAKNNIPFVFRTQEAPEQNIEEFSNKVAEGPAREYAKRGLLKKSNISTTPGIHSGLGLNFYSQVTSPIRRFLDYILLTQIRFFIEKSEVKYSEDFLSSITGKLQLGLDEANIIQRERNRFWLLKYLEQEKLHKLSGILVRNDGSRPLAEIDNLYCLFPFNPISRANCQLGNRVNLKITKLDPLRDKIYIDEIEEEKTE